VHRGKRKTVREKRCGPEMAGPTGSHGQSEVSVLILTEAMGEPPYRNMAAENSAAEDHESPG